MWLCGHQRDVEKTSHPFVLIVGKGKRKPHLFHSWRNPLTRLSTWKWKISNVSSNKLQQPPLTTHLCIDNFSFEELYHVMKRNSYAGCWNDRQLFVLPPQRCTPGWTQAAYSLKHSIAQKYLLYIPHHIPICWVVMDWTHTQGVLQPTGSSSKSTCGYWKDICLQTMTFWNYSWL